MRVEVRAGDVAWNPHANGGKGAPIPSGWRAEAIGPYEYEGNQPIRYQWSTRLDPSYVVDPLVDDPADKDNYRKPIWQLIFQWHQGDTDVGTGPPIAFIILRDDILLSVNKHDAMNPDKSINVGQWPVAKLDRGKWHDFEAEIRWHSTQLSIKFWYNGCPIRFLPQVPAETPNEPAYPTQATDTLTGLGTLFPPRTGSTKPSSAYMKVGLYRKGVATSPPGPFILYHDEISRYEQGMVMRPALPSDLLKKLVKLPWKITKPPIPPKPPVPPPPPGPE